MSSQKQSNNPTNTNQAINYHQRQRFKRGAALRPYLVRKKPNSGLAHRETTSLHEVLQLLKDIISDEKLYDERNASIVLPDRDLEDALDVKALHLTEIREQVMKQLEPAARTQMVVGGSKTNVRVLGGGSVAATTTAAATTQTTGTQQQQPLPPLGGQNASTTTTTPISIPNTSQTIAALRARLNQVAVRGPNGHGGTAVTLNPSPTGQQQQQQQQQRNQPPVITNVTPQSEFEVKPEFRKVLKAVPGVRDDQSVFTYDELTKHLSHYILSRKERFFDDRNIKVALVNGDQLGVAFGVKAFHRTQVTSLLRTQLIPYVRRPCDQRPPPNNPNGRHQPPHRQPSKDKSPDKTSSNKTPLANQVKKEVDSIKKEVKESDQSEMSLAERLKKARAERDEAERMLARLRESLKQQEATVAARVETGPGQHPDLYQATQAALAKQNGFNNVTVKVEPGVTVKTEPGLPGVTVKTEPGLPVPVANIKTEPLDAGESANATVGQVTVFPGTSTDRQSRIRKREPSFSNSSTPAAQRQKCSSSPSPTTSNFANQRRPSFNRQGSNGDVSSDAETIYSEQGYDTVAICSVVEDDASDDDDNNVQHESEVVESSEDDEVDNEPYTEYEVDSEADRAAANRDDNEGNSSAEDSDVHDVVIAASAAMILRDAADDADFWADSESDFELSNFDPELAPTGSETWKCVACGCANTPFIRYCGGCWKERKGWVPDRPKPRRKRKRKDRKSGNKSVNKKQYDTNTVVVGRVTLDRSISHPGPSTSKDLTNLQMEHESKTNSDDDKHKMPCPSTSTTNLAKHSSIGSVCGSSSQADSGYGQSSQESVMTTEEREESNSSPDLLNHSDAEGHSDSDDNESRGPARKSARVSSDDDNDNNDLESSLRREEEFRQSRAKSLEKGYTSSSSSMTSSSKLLSERFATVSTSKPELLCNFCLSREKDAGIIHGGIIHQICCYPCAKRLYKKRQQCPMCRRKIEKISKIIVG